MRTSRLCFLLVVALFPGSRILLSADCNENRVADSKDIAAGTSRDCNANLIPDECDLLPSGLGFTVSQKISLGRDAGWVDLGDLDGDGDLDLIVAPIQIQEDPADGIFVLMNRGDATFEHPFSLRTGLGPFFVKAADLNGDGKLDILSANLEGSSLTLQVNKGNRAFEASELSLQELPSFVLPADLDGDRTLDLIVVNSRSTAFSQFMGRADGTYSPPLVTKGGGFPDAGDLDGDGDVDLVIFEGSASMSTLSVLWNEGKGLVPTQAKLLTGSGIWSAFARDLDGDGLADLALGGGQCRILMNRGNRVFGGLRNLGPGSPHVFDLDGDGDLDVATYEPFGRDPISVLTNDGTGLFTADERFIVGASGSWFRSFVSGDLDGDGLADLIWSDVRDLFVALQDPAGGFGRPFILRTKSWVQSLIVEDWNRDGRIDLVVAGSDISVVFGNGSGSVGPADRYAVSGQPPISGDFDGDGDRDLTLLTQPPGQWPFSIAVLQNQGDGKFKTRVDTTPAAGLPVVEIVAANVDKDGKLDLIARAAAGLEAKWILALVNAGDATFIEKDAVPIPKDSYHLTAADMNGDGLSDVVIPQLFAGTVTIYMNRGDGTFEEYSILDVKAEARAPAAVADLDGDGQLDLAVPYWAGATGGSSGVSVLRGLRVGEFAPAKNYSVGEGPTDIQAVDMDGDGSLDLVLPCDFGFNVSVLLNRGDGTFFKNRAFPFGISARSLFAATPDLDGDGFPDLAVADDNGGVLTLNLNTTRPPLSRDENRNGIPDPCERTPFHRGDADVSGAVELTDPIFILDHLFTAGPAPPCREAADADNDGALVVTDAIQLLLYLFLGGTPPADPGPPPAACGQDADAPGAAGDLGCDAYGRC